MEIFNYSKKKSLSQPPPFLVFSYNSIFKFNQLASIPWTEIDQHNEIYDLFLTASLISLKLIVFISP